MTLPFAFFTREADGTFVATDYTRGPWDSQLMHGGPVAALLGRELEKASEDFPIAKVAFEFLRPLAMGAYRVETSLQKSGKQVQRIEARLLAGTVEVARATSLHLRRAPLVLPTAPWMTPKTPEACTPLELDFFRDPIGYHKAIEVRVIDGVWAQSPVTAWMKLLVNVVEGQEPSPLERVLSCVDAESGVGPPLDPRDFTFLNPDLTAYVVRPLVGPWLGMRITSALGSDTGIGLSEAALFDGQGPLGRSVQSLLLAARR